MPSPGAPMALPPPSAAKGIALTLGLLPAAATTGRRPGHDVDAAERAQARWTVRLARAATP